MAIHITKEEKALLFTLVREGLRLSVMEKRHMTEEDFSAILHAKFPESAKKNTLLSGNLKEKMGAFVTYHIDKSAYEASKHNQTSVEKMALSSEHTMQLRGCIGMLIGQFPLWLTVSQMAYKAACEDTRFLPISEAELPYISYDITALEPLRICEDITAIELGKHGILLQAHGRQAVFLPHVAIEQGWSLEETFEQLCYKAGLPKGTWKEPETVFYWYEGLLLHPDV